MYFVCITQDRMKMLFVGDTEWHNDIFSHPFRFWNLSFGHNEGGKQDQMRDHSCRIM